MAYKKQYGGVRSEHAGVFAPADKPEQPKEKPVVVPSAPAGEGLVEATNNAVNIRLAPGTDGEIIGQVARGEKLAYKGETQTVENTPWYKVEYDGKDAWISGNISKIVG